MMKMIIKGSRIELIPEEEIDRARLAQIPEGSNKVFVYTTLDGGDEGNQEALVIYIGSIPSKEEISGKETLEERVEREADEKYRDEHDLNFDGSPIVYPSIEDINPTEFLATIVCSKEGCDFNCRDPEKMLAHMETHRDDIENKYLEFPNGKIYGSKEEKEAS